MGYADGTISRLAYNERIKLLSQTLQNFGVALTIVLIGNVLTAGLNPAVVYGTIIAIFLFASAHNVLGNLEGDDG